MQCFAKRFVAPLLLVFSLLFATTINASTQSTQQQADEVIAKIYTQLKQKEPSTMAERIALISQALLDKPYLLGALGEGVDGSYDQSPLYRTDAFDCETYVDVVLAIALAQNPDTFKHCIRKIRYKDGQVSFTGRNHFLSLDWNQNNQQQNFIKDISGTLKNKNNQPVVKTAKALINKPAWYHHLKIDSIKLEHPQKEKQQQQLLALKKAGSQLQKSISRIDYVPLSALFDKNEQPNLHLFRQIPNAAIIEIIRPNWDLRKAIGTCLNASHLGFAIWKGNTLYFREASSIHDKTVDVPLIDYLKETLKSPTIKGIHIETVVPEKPLSGTCEVNG